MQADVVGVGVVHEDVVLGKTALADAHGADLLAVVDQAAVAVLAEDHLLAVVQHDGVVGLDGRIGQRLVRPVVEDHAVGQHLHHGAAVVQGGRRHDLLVELELHVQRAGEEGALGAQHKRARVERVLDGAVGRGFRDRAELGGRRILPLGQAVDLVVEEDDVDVDVAPDGVDEMVAADGEGIAVAAGLPDRQPGIRHLDAGGDRRGAAVDAVEPVGVHIIRKAGGASDAGHHHVAFLIVIERLAHLGERALQRGQHRVVAASGAPADLLVAFEILESQCCHNPTSPFEWPRPTRSRGTAVPGPC